MQAIWPDFVLLNKNSKKGGLEMSRGHPVVATVFYKNNTLAIVTGTGRAHFDYKKTQSPGGATFITF